MRASAGRRWPLGPRVSGSSKSCNFGQFSPKFEKGAPCSCRRWRSLVGFGRQLAKFAQQGVRQPRCGLRRPAEGVCSQILCQIAGGKGTSNEESSDEGSFDKPCFHNPLDDTIRPCRYNVHPCQTFGRAQLELCIDCQGVTENEGGDTARHLHGSTQ